MKADLWRGTLDFDSDTFKIILVLTDSTAVSEEDITRIAGGSGFATLDEAAGYTRPTLAGLTITQDDATDEGLWDAASPISIRASAFRQPMPPSQQSP